MWDCLNLANDGWRMNSRMYTVILHFDDWHTVIPIWHIDFLIQKMEFNLNHNFLNFMFLYFGTVQKSELQLRQSCEF